MAASNRISFSSESAGPSGGDPGARMMPPGSLSGCGGLSSRRRADLATELRAVDPAPSPSADHVPEARRLLCANHEPPTGRVVPPTLTLPITSGVHSNPEPPTREWPPPWPDSHHATMSEAYEVPPCLFGQGEYRRAWWPRPLTAGARSMVVIIGSTLLLGLLLTLPGWFFWRWATQ